ncbi:hypothetical protein [Nitrosospira multiformis]|nr:hypothetical protein [Nitrosospira multiformis]
MKQFWTLKKAIISSLATMAFALAGGGMLHAQTGTGATTGTPSQGVPGMQSAPGQYDAGSGEKGQYDKGQYGQKGERSKKGTDMDRRGDDSSTGYSSGGSSAGGAGGSYGSGSGADSGGGSKY